MIGDLLAPGRVSLAFDRCDVTASLDSDINSYASHLFKPRLISPVFYSFPLTPKQRFIGSGSKCRPIYFLVCVQRDEPKGRGCWLGLVIIVPCGHACSFTHCPLGIFHQLPITGHRSSTGGPVCLPGCTGPLGKCSIPRAGRNGGLAGTCWRLRLIVERDSEARALTSVRGGTVSEDSISQGVRSTLNLALTRPN